MVKLSEKQRSIVEHKEGAILVKAGPGSGKTRVLTERIKHLLLDKKRCKILALTFSNFATDEMRNRLQEDTAIRDCVENVTVGTIHSFCLEMVQTRGNLAGLNQDIVIFESEEDRASILRDVFVADPQFYSVLVNAKQKPDVFIKKCLSKISDFKKRFISPEMCNYGELFPLVYRAYNESLLKQNALDFDDMLFYAYRILIENPAVVKLYTSLYKYICVDEAQDLNYAQYNVIKALCGKEFCNIMLVGDENQAVYGFNGSDSKFMTVQFVNDFKPKEYLLNKNYRSARAIVAFANKLGNYNSETNFVYEGELTASSYHDEKEEAGAVFNKIKYLLAKGHRDIENKLSYSDFVIIGRNKYVFREIENILAENRIPYFYKKINNGIDIESDYIKAFELSIRLIINPQDTVHLRELSRLVKVRIARSNLSIIDKLNKILLHGYANLLPALTLLQNADIDFDKVLNALENNLPDDLSDDDRYLIMNDIDQWKKHWKKYKSIVPGENRSLLSFRNHISLGKTHDIQYDNGVALLSAHISKGLQYEVVFIIGLTEGTFPDYRAVRAGETELNQEKNSMYVAVTRAKRLCYLSCPQTKLMPWGDYKRQTPSRYIQDILDRERL
ncbi:MAG: ATP-dependent helicase [Tannerella sp.]|jgi:DNA helicase-2/ATP-dependent DNA helicase PcrA|nr:ATP-dependent helicase [Tannerella sp.]